MSRDLELTDTEWQRVTRLMPRDQQRGGRWRDHRQVINGILWRLRTGAPWRDVPDRYGPWQTLHKRLRRWQLDGTWARIEAVLQNDTDVAEELDRYVDVPFVEMDADRESVRSGPDGPPLR